MKQWIKKTIATLTASALAFGSAGVLPEGMFDGIINKISATDEIPISETVFPDETFRRYISEYFDIDQNDVLSRSEVDNIKNISVSSMGITNLKGIEYFYNLEMLLCVHNELTNLDVSKNLALKRLQCSNNKLSVLNVRNNTALTYLDCYLNQITELDISQNTALTSLGCHFNNLKSLDISNNEKLTFLCCSFNELTELDVSYNKDLTNLQCGGNSISSLDVKNNMMLSGLFCGSNNISILDISKNAQLVELDCSDNPLVTICLTNNVKLRSLRCYDNHFTNLDISQNTDLTYLECTGNQLTNLDLSKNTALTWVYCYDNQLTHLDVSNNTKLERLLCYRNKLTSLDVSNNVLLEMFDCNDNILEIEITDNAFNLSNIPYFDASKASNWNGASYNSNTNSLEYFTKQEIMTFLTDITSEYKRIYEIGSRYPDVTLTMIQDAFSNALFDNRKNVNVLDFRKAIENSKHIYEDIIKKALPEFDAKFQTEIEQAKLDLINY